MAKRTTTKAGARNANVFGADPHKRTVTATVLDERGGVLGTETFRVSGDGHRAMERWALQFGPIQRWGIEGASGIGRHSAMFLIRQGHDVRDVCPNRTAEQARHRQQGKTDALDSVRRVRRSRTSSPTCSRHARMDCRFLSERRRWRPSSCVGWKRRSQRFDPVRGNGTRSTFACTPFRRWDAFVS